MRARAEEPGEQESERPYEQGSPVTVWSKGSAGEGMHVLDTASQNTDVSAERLNHDGSVPE